MNVNPIISLNENAAIKYWWLSILVGALLLITGIAVFVFPAASFLSMAMIFGFLILIGGISELAIAWSGRNAVVRRGWLTAAGIIQIGVGVILMFDIGLSFITLPIFLGFWLMFRGFTLIGVGGDMSSMKVNGWGWTLFSGVALVICAFIVLVQPFVYGVEVVVIWVGISLFVGGLSTITMGWQLRDVHKKLV